MPRETPGGAKTAGADDRAGIEPLEGARAIGYASVPRQRFDRRCLIMDAPSVLRRSRHPRLQASHGIDPSESPVTHRFFSIHHQGFVRVAACTPRIAVGDPAANAAETLALMQDGDAKAVDLMVFPELWVCAYAIDDLHLQDALLDAVEHGIARLVAARGRCGPCCSSARRCATTAGSTTARVVIARGEILGVVPKSFLPNYREYYEKRWFAPAAGVRGRD